MRAVRIFDTQLRHRTHIQARDSNPDHWSETTRNQLPIRAITHNPDRDAVIRNRPEVKSSCGRDRFMTSARSAIAESVGTLYTA